MKTLKIAISILLFTFTTNAQITKGNWMVGGSGSYINYSIKSSANGNTIDSNNSQLLISPTIGYFVANNFACGLSSNFGISMPETGRHSTTYGIGPFARYYFLKPEKMINILTQVGYYYGISNDESKTNNVDFKAGPVVFFNKSVGLEFTINYSISKYSDSSYNSTSRILNIGVGFQIHLEKNEKIKNLIK
jgi:hypothetical protein